MMLKTVYQWDLDSKENIAAFEAESRELAQQAERAVCRRSDNILPGPHPRQTYQPPCISREEFLTGIRDDLDWGFLFEDDQDYEVYHGDRQVHSEYDFVWGRDIPRQIVVRAVVEHRDGKPVRAEFLEVRGEAIAEITHPNVGGIRAYYWDEDGEFGFLMEDSDGKFRVDTELYIRAHRSYMEGIDLNPEGKQLLKDTLKRLNRNDLDYRDEMTILGLLQE